MENDPYGFIYQDEEQLSEKSKELRDEMGLHQGDGITRTRDI